MNSDLCTLNVGDRVVAYCRDGLLEVEYVLFDPEEVIVSGTLGQATRETGYLTTAKQARQRLREAGITAGLAQEAFAALNRSDARALAQVPSIGDVLHQLTACEAFEGGEFFAATHTFAGAWLDLRCLANACPLIGVSQILQALHLDLALEEVNGETSVSLLTADAIAGQGPGLRTWKPVRLEVAKKLPGVIRTLPAAALASDRSPRDEAAWRQWLVQGLNARAAASTTARPRLQMLAAALVRGKPSSVYVAPSAPPAPLQSRVARPLAPDAPESLRSPSRPDSRLFEELSELAKNLRGEQEAFANARVIDFVPEPVKPSAVVVSLTTEPSAPRLSVHPTEPWRLVGLSPEIVETLPLPAGATEDMLASDQRPRTPMETRIAMTRLARTLGRDYRRWYGSSLRATVAALEVTQRHLCRTFGSISGDGGGPAVDAAVLEAECTRHGALLSEILARTLGAAWVDISSDRPQDWAMALPSAVRVCPIDRVRRYLEQGRREQDLIAFFSELEATLRPVVSM